MAGLDVASDVLHHRSRSAILHYINPLPKFDVTNKPGTYPGDEIYNIVMDKPNYRPLPDAWEIAIYNAWGGWNADGWGYEPSFLADHGESWHDPSTWGPQHYDGFGSLHVHLQVYYPAGTIDQWFGTPVI
jgi:hypothetical protein